MWADRRVEKLGQKDLGNREMREKQNGAKKIKI